MIIASSTRNVIQLGIGFMFVFGAFNSQGFIEQTVITSVWHEGGNVAEHAGYYSLSIIYLVFTFANFLAGPIVEIIGPRWALCIGTFGYTLFLVGFHFLNSYYLYFSAALLGLCAAVTWTGHGNYLTLNSDEEHSGRNSGLFWALHQTSLPAGGLFLFFVFRSKPRGSTIDEETIHILYGVFAGIALIGNLILATLPIPNRSPTIEHQVVEPSSYSKSIEVQHQQRPSLATLLGLTFKLLQTNKMRLLTTVYIYSGIEQSFVLGIYSTCISFTLQLGTNTNELIALNVIAFGVANIIGSGLFGILGKKTIKFGRFPVVLLGWMIHTACFVLIYVNIPGNATLHQTNEQSIIHPPSVIIAIVCGAMLGFGDSCWMTQMYSITVANYQNESAQAFSLMKFFQSLLSCAAFFYGSYLQLQWHLLILIISSSIAAICFFIVEKMSKRIMPTQLVVDSCDETIVTKKF